MRALIVYESMFGNTHAIADHIADGLRSAFEVSVTSAAEARIEEVLEADLLVVGGPTHAHSLSSRFSRRMARRMAENPKHPLPLDATGGAIGVRDLFRRLPHVDHGLAAAFDTRGQGPAALTGRAAAGITRRLRHHGYHLVNRPESFLVDQGNRLARGEPARAMEWGRQLATVYGGRLVA